MILLIVSICVCVCSKMEIYKQEQVERKRSSNSERRGYCVLLSDEEQKKTPSLARRNYLLLVFHWIAPSFSRPLADEPAREEKKKKKASNDEVQKEWWRARKKINQPNNRQYIIFLLFIFCCCHIDSNEKSAGERHTHRDREKENARKVGIPLDAHIQHNHTRCNTSFCFSQEIEAIYMYILSPRVFYHWCIVTLEFARRISCTFTRIHILFFWHFWLQ